MCWRKTLFFLKWPVWTPVTAEKEDGLRRSPAASSLPRRANRRDHTWSSSSRVLVPRPGHNFGGGLSWKVFYKIWKGLESFLQLSTVLMPEFCFSSLGLKTWFGRIAYEWKRHMQLSLLSSKSVISSLPVASSSFFRVNFSSSHLQKQTLPLHMRWALHFFCVIFPCPLMLFGLVGRDKFLEEIYRVLSILFHPSQTSLSPPFSAVSFNFLLGSSITSIRPSMIPSLRDYSQRLQVNSKRLVTNLEWKKLSQVERGFTGVNTYYVWKLDKVL